MVPTDSSSACTKLHGHGCLVVRTVKSALWLQDTLFHVPSSKHELTHFETTVLHDLQTGFHSIDFSADRRLVGNTNHLSPTLSLI